MRNRRTEPQNIIRIRKLATARIHVLNKKLCEELFRDPYLLNKGTVVLRADEAVGTIVHHYKEHFLPEILSQVYMVSHNYGLQEVHCH